MTLYEPLLANMIYHEIQTTNTNAIGALANNLELYELWYCLSDYGTR